MGQLFTLGGDRLGSGKNQKVELHNYMMNSFNLEQDFKSTMAPGVLYPFIKAVGTPHGTFDIDMDSFVRTLPTRGPLFGSFKMQVDLFSVPFRLYQGVLHNNPIDIGLNMNQVYLPKLLMKHKMGSGAAQVNTNDPDNLQVAPNALVKYLGVSGIGGITGNFWGTPKDVIRKFNAVPILAYYDIFKCYYSNKQEENAYVITPSNIAKRKADVYLALLTDKNELFGSTSIFWNEIKDIVGDDEYKGVRIRFEGKDLYEEGITIKINGYYEDTEVSSNDNTLNNLIDDGYAVILKKEKGRFTIYDVEDNYGDILEIMLYPNKWIIGETGDIETDSILIQWENTPTGELPDIYTSSIALTPFKLKNIDKMRYALLKENEIGTEFLLGDSDYWGATSGEDNTGLPYSTLFKQTDEGIGYNAFEMNGLMVKTYQSDLFNNWLDTEYIDGENGISAITAVDTQSGSFTMDTLNLAEKFYELLNRIIVAGGTYEDWQEAVYGEGVVRMCETPMYIGGMSSEIMFEEVIANTENESAQQALGSLGGKGTQTGKKGGNNIHVKMSEPGYIIGIVSITPRICYSQGNDWDMTELDTLDDLHKPQLDGIGFQPLMIEQMAWWDTAFTNSTTFSRRSAGKQTAWINYQTAIDKCYGDFAKSEGYAFMVLNRNYERDTTTPGKYVRDITTYIDPAKFNYAFAYTDLSAQNFWVQLHSKVTARRKMGAQQIPNL